MDVLKAQEEGRMGTLVEELAMGKNKFMTKVYDWMGLGFLLTAAVAYSCAATPGVMGWLEHHRGLVFLILIAEVCLAQYISYTGAKESISQNSAIGLFLAYCAANGLTLSPLLHIYTSASVHAAFFTTAAIFLTMSAYGHLTKRDLSEPRSLAVQALWGVILAMLVNIFLGNALIDFVISCVCVVLFTGLIAFDTQMLRDLSRGREGDSKSSLPIVGALILYLDFLNLFVHILRLFGERKE